MSDPYRERLEKKIADEHMQRTQALAMGYVTTIEDYRQRAGFLEGLRWCIDACEQAERELNKED